MNVIRTEWKINGILIQDLPVDWQSTRTSIIFDKLSNRNVITADRFIFHGDAAQIIKNWLADRDWETTGKS